MQTQCDHSADAVPTTKSITLATSVEFEERKNRAKKKNWYNVIYPTYKSRSETFHKLFKEVPENERLVVGKKLSNIF